MTSSMGSIHWSFTLFSVTMLPDAIFHINHQTSNQIAEQNLKDQVSLDNGLLSVNFIFSIYN